MWTLFFALLAFSALSFSIVWLIFREDLLKPESISFFSIFLLPPILISMIVGFIAIKKSKTFDEYWGNYYAKVSHYDSWDERVNCDHPIYRSETHLAPHTYFVNGEMKVRIRQTTKRVLVGYDHPFDVNYHDETWNGTLDDGREIGISKEEYEYYSSVWENSETIDLNRSFHSKDGDKQESIWDNNINTVFPSITIHRYENRIRAAGSFRNKNIPEDLKALFQHPILRKSTDSVFAYNLPIDIRKENEKLTKINAFYGYQKEIHVMLFVLNAKKFDKDIVETINRIWEGPNKNELAIFVGVEEDSNGIIWCDVLSWCGNKDIHLKTIEQIMDMKVYNGIDIVDSIIPLITTLWNRRHFSEFDNVKVLIPRYVYITAISSFLVFQIVMWSILTVVYLREYKDEKKNVNNQFSKKKNYPINKRKDWPSARTSRY